MRVNHISVLFLLGAASFSSVLQAEPKPYAPTPQEIAMMPRGCQVKLNPKPADGVGSQLDWDARVGPGCWVHIHHYCNGLKSIMRARMAFENTDKSFYLKQAIGEFDYVLQHCPTTAKIIPEVKNQKQQAKYLLNTIRR